MNVCIFESKHVVRELTSLVPFPVNNPFHTTVMPKEFRVYLVILMVLNLVSIMVWEYFFVNGFVPWIIRRCKHKSKDVDVALSKNDEKDVAAMEEML